MTELFRSAGKKATSWSVGDLSSWDVSNVTSMDSLFESVGYSATTLNLNLSNWNTSKVTAIRGIF